MNPSICPLIEAMTDNQSNFIVKFYTLDKALQIRATDAESAKFLRERSFELCRSGHGSCQHARRENVRPVGKTAVAYSMQAEVGHMTSEQIAQLFPGLEIVDITYQIDSEENI